MAMCLDNDDYNEKWELTTNSQIRQIKLDLCLDYESLNAQDHVYATKCDPYSATQKWAVEK